MKHIDRRLGALEASHHAQRLQYRPPVVVDVVGLNADEAAAQIAAAEAQASTGVPIRMIIIDCPSLRKP